jgi:transcriptional regulator with XRE-family HTH domain
MSSRLNADLGRRIRERREELGKTQAWLADQVGLSRTAVTNIECGRQRLVVDQLVLIASVLKTTADRLLPPMMEECASHSSSPGGLEENMPTVARWLSTVIVDRGE